MDVELHDVSDSFIQGVIGIDEEFGVWKLDFGYT